MTTFRRIALAVGAAALLSVGPHPADASPADGNPEGAFDSLSARGNGGYWMFGWAADPDAPGQQIEVHLYFHIVEGALPMGGTKTGEARPDVQRVVAFAGPNSGWSFKGELNPSRNSRAVCAYAINVGRGTNRQIGCHRFPPTGPHPRDPVGNMDSIHGNEGRLGLIGWTGDHDGQSPIVYEVYNHSGPRGPERLFVGETSFPRADVQSLYPSFGSNAGINVSLPFRPTPSGRTETICVYALNEGREGPNNTTLGCRAITASTYRTSALGHIDSVSVSDGKLRVRGWTWDQRATPSDPTPVDIRFVVEQTVAHLQDPLPWQNHTVRITTTDARPDVERAHPGASGPRGFDAVIHEFAPGTRLAFAYGLGVCGDAGMTGFGYSPGEPGTMLWFDCMAVG